MSEMIERVATAWKDEFKRWVGRTNKMRDDDKCYEVCRFDDSGFTGSFSEIHAFAGYRKSCTFHEAIRVERAARAAIEAMREPTQAMLDATGEVGVPDRVYREYWQAMIDEALK